MDDLIAIFKEKCSFFILQNKRYLSAGIACLAGVLVLVIYFQTAPGSDAYLAAEESVIKWQELEDDASYIEMRKALKKVPSLEKKYGSVIAQKLFQRNRLADALSLAHKSIHQIEEDAPFHLSLIHI